MLTFRTASALVGLVLACACGSTQGANPIAGSSANPTSAPSSNQNQVLVAFAENLQTTGQPTVTLTRTDGKAVATLKGRGVGDEHAIGAYLVQASDGSGAEWTVDAAGVIKPVAPAAAKLLTVNTPGFPLILNSTTAIIGCVQAPNGDCTAEEVNLTTGAIRPLLTVPGTGAATMALGMSLTVLDASSDLSTVWFREITSVVVPNGGAPTGKLNIVGVDLRTGNITRRSLPVALVSEQYLAISQDGKWVAGQEDAGLDANHVATRHLHIVSVVTGVDSDVQGTAPYVASGLRTSIQFAPGGAAVAWFGPLNSGPAGTSLNVAPSGAVGTAVPSFGDQVSGVFWLDGSRLVAQDLHGAAVTIDTGTGAVNPLNLSVAYLLSVLR